MHMWACETVLKYSVYIVQSGMIMKTYEITAVVIAQWSE